MAELSTNCVLYDRSAATVSILGGWVVGLLVGIDRIMTSLLNLSHFTACLGGVLGFLVDFTAIC